MRTKTQKGENILLCDFGDKRMLSNSYELGVNKNENIFCVYRKDNKLRFNKDDFSDCAMYDIYFFHF